MTTVPCTTSTPLAVQAAFTPTAIAVMQPDAIFDSQKGLELRSAVARLCSAQLDAIAIDFSQVTFMDSSGLGVLLLMQKTARSAGIPLYLCALNDQCQMMLELTRADTLFEIFPDVLAAQRYASKPAT